MILWRHKEGGNATALIMGVGRGNKVIAPMDFEHILLNLLSFLAFKTEWL